LEAVKESCKNLPYWWGMGARTLKMWMKKWFCYLARCYESRCWGLPWTI